MKPKYSLLKNSSYAISGLMIAIKNESSFRLELIFGLFIVTAIVLLDLSVTHKLILFATALLVLVVELLNSAVESVVDLVTKEIHPLAKNAKDLGSAAVMVAILLHIICWVVVLATTIA